MKKIIVSIITIIILALVGWAVAYRSIEAPSGIKIESKKVEIYTSDKFSVEYPVGYEIEIDSNEIVTIFNTVGKIIIGDFDPSAGPSPAELTKEQINTLPKNIKYHGYDGVIASALFYATSDEKTRQELENIQNSIQLK